MLPLIKSGQLVTVVPIIDDVGVGAGDIVLCKVNGREYLHKVLATTPNQAQIGNNRGKVNGWTSFKNVYGKCVKVES